MDRSLRKFARRIVLVHLALLVPLLAIVFAASREVYRSAHEQALQQARKQQELLAGQTASGLKGYYDSIFSDLQLFKPVDPDDDDDVDDRTLEDQLVQPNMPPMPGQPLMGGQPPGPMRVPTRFLSILLNGRVSHLFTVPRGGPYFVRASGPQATSPSVTQIIEHSHDWIDSVVKPTISSLEQFSDSRGDVRGFNLIGVPIEGGSRTFVLVASVPVRSTARRFFDQVNQVGDSAAVLLDEQMTVMASSRTDRVGGAVDPDVAAEVSRLGADGGGAGLLSRSFTLGSRTFSPSMIAVEPAKILDKQWYVLIVTPQTDVDAVVVPLLRKAIFWAIFVALSMTAILVSTAVQLIRNRMRSDRERHQMLEKELRQARDIQLHWLPQPRARDGTIDIATINHPASRISGDFYNWFDLPDGRTAVVIGDVTGHGMAAAFLMATTQLLVRNTLPLTCDPGRCLAEINRQLCTQVFNGQFVTLQILALDPHTGRADIATAGHPPPLIEQGDRYQALKLEPNLVLGVDRNATYQTQTFTIPPMSAVLLYTDGVLDAESRKGDRFGMERLRRTLGHGGGDPHRMVQNVLGAIDSFRGGLPLGDDLTMVAVQLQNEPAAAGAGARPVPQHV